MYNVRILRRAIKDIANLPNLDKPEPKRDWV